MAKDREAWRTWGHRVGHDWATEQQQIVKTGCGVYGNSIHFKSETILKSSLFQNKAWQDFLLKRLSFLSEFHNLKKDFLKHVVYLKLTFYFKTGCLKKDYVT